MKTLVCLLEGESEETLLRTLIPRLISSDIELCFQVFNGKQDMDKHLVHRMKYWLAPDSVFLVMRDQDSHDCVVLKKQLLSLVEQAGKQDRCLVRIACHELESFYLGDLGAVAEAFKNEKVTKLSKKKKYRDPDLLANAHEEFGRLLPQNASRSKTMWAALMAPHLGDEQSNQSTSYRALLTGLRRLLA